MNIPVSTEAALHALAAVTQTLTPEQRHQLASALDGAFELLRDDEDLFMDDGVHFYLCNIIDAVQL